VTASITESNNEIPIQSSLYFAATEYCGIIFWIEQSGKDSSCWPFFVFRQ